jgi:hypothetical protein
MEDAKESEVGLSTVSQAMQAARNIKAPTARYYPAGWVISWKIPNVKICKIWRI